MARDYTARWSVGATRRGAELLSVSATLLLLFFLLLLADQGAVAQKVRVEEELEAYPTESVDLRCQFIDGGGKTKLTQVSWIWEPIDGQRDNIAVYHPMYGQSFPNPEFKDRVVFLHNSLENPSIRISDLKMADAGRYTCEYATYPTGNEQGTTTLIMLAKPKNAARVVTVQTGSKAVVVARCEAVEGKPAASIRWLGSVGGNHSTSSTSGPDGTVTVRSEYRLVPTPADNGRELTCLVDQRTQDQTWVYPIKLSVEYPPSVSIEGYDHNWYMGRSDATLMCLANANPAPTTVTWTSVSGPLPDSVVVDGNKLTVRKVDDAVNTTFVCEVKNKLGSTKNQITTIVIEEERQNTDAPSTGAVIGGILGSLAFIGIIVGVILYVRNRHDEDGPPKHKPPPPVKTGSSTEMLNKPSEPPSNTETVPLSPDVYYETSGTEPVTNLDDESSGGALNGGANYDNMNDGLHGNDFDPTNHDTGTVNIARGESFVSPAMYV
ncbi:PVR cell adhesion molecule related 2 like isoform X2 [Periophthalmus magnuspinnatus]|uniref:PVR cell adhesion molecule related 2 like isoform X2 n=1 Tax=Periophthalmus magnuspinnatus TaxID=409849 RepID=UPI0024367036|nr:PVR cell adhesion molecule related 2 like isoform X2 [Periophthalmus magnuspinnatus]